MRVRPTSGSPARSCVSCACARTPTELAELRAAGAAIDRVHARVGEWLRPGRTEAEVAADIAAAIVEEGHAAAEFVIVGSGPNGASPHHSVSDRVIERGDVVVVDIGGPLPSGYNSDSTRTYAVGSPREPDVAEAYAALQAAQQAAVDAVRPGVTCEAVDAAARSVLAEAGLAERFIHRTGHGIGLDVHEEPYIVAGNDLPVEPGMTFSHRARRLPRRAGGALASRTSSRSRLTGSSATTPAPRASSSSDLPAPQGFSQARVDHLPTARGQESKPTPMVSRALSHRLRLPVRSSAASDDRVARTAAYRIGSGGKGIGLRRTISAGSARCHVPSTRSSATRAPKRVEATPSPV